MPLLSEPFGDLFIILFTIFWGIVIETRFVTRHTIWFNVVPLVVLLSTIELNLDDVLTYGLIGYAIGSIGLSMVPKKQKIKQLVGAKGYGSLSLSLFIFRPSEFPLEVSLAIWIVFAVVVYAVWWILRGKIRKSKN